MAKKIAIGADHGGFLLKEKIKGMLEKSGFRMTDAGTFSEESCDYPEIGFNVAKEVATGKAFRGIVICKTGIGMSVVANKLPGVRAGLCSSKEDASSAREHNDTNVLVLAATKLSDEKAFEIVRTWIDTPGAVGRHARRIRQIKAFEKKVFKKFK
ncbi:MAG TPA: ribose 5-phosphate isomerase B [Candidatus Omnitrophota bacterium]|nr:ribose 5-phosphate isomerase B [Candidatus Omnitrophota bacterium]HPS19665.1 ribose 5-phosphate isomerase B [Candidatus Omnitrophota bacterium]